MSEASSAASGGSTSDSNEPDAGSCSRRSRTSGDAGCLPPGSPVSPATKMYEAWDALNHAASAEVPTLGQNTGMATGRAGLIFSAEGSPAKTSASPANEQASLETAAACSSSSPASQTTLFSPEGLSSLRTYPDSFPATVAGILVSFSR